MMAMGGMNKPPLRVATYAKVVDVAPGTYGHNLVLRVLNVNVVVENHRIDGALNRVAEVTLADETGCVVLRARNEQIDLAADAEAVVVRNARVLMFKGFIRIIVTKW
mmetsp:Transcript_16541/g.50728  ORF Transcript_16541/g.50728 Transcript_16541/m.50728 type:complete len:107 (-) Transcript_16541:2241-2561(-)